MARLRGSASNILFRFMLRRAVGMEPIGETRGRGHARGGARVVRRFDALAGDLDRGRTGVLFGAPRNHRSKKERPYGRARRAPRAVGLGSAEASNGAKSQSRGGGRRRLRPDIKLGQASRAVVLLA